MAHMTTNTGAPPEATAIHTFWYELTFDQKRFIEARGLCDSDNEASRLTRISLATVKWWKRHTGRSPFKQVYNYLIVDMDNASTALLRSRMVMLTGMAMSTLEKGFQTIEPTSEQVAMGKLALELLKEVRRPTKNGDRVISSTTSDKHGDPLALNIDVTEITATTLKNREGGHDAG